MVFGEVVVLARPVVEADALLFHELVHVVQVGEFGLGGFVRRYLVGWLAAGRRYREIPLERQAFALEAKYRANPRGGFSVEEAVRRGEGLGLP